MHDKNNKCNYFYDCLAIKEKIIFEYNGIHFHAKSQDDPNFYNPFNNITAKEQWELDQNKKACAERNGYKIYYIWEDESEDKAIERCIGILNEVYKNR